MFLGFINKVIGLVGLIAVPTKHYQNLEKRVDFFPLNYINAARFLYLYKLFDLIKDIKGDVVECGVGHGRSFLSLASIIEACIC